MLLITIKDEVSTNCRHVESIMIEVSVLYPQNKLVDCSGGPPGAHYGAYVGTTVAQRPASCRERHWWRACEAPSPVLAGCSPCISRLRLSWLCLRPISTQHLIRLLSPRGRYYHLFGPNNCRDQVTCMIGIGR